MRNIIPAVPITLRCGSIFVVFSQRQKSYFSGGLHRVSTYSGAEGEKLFFNNTITKTQGVIP